MNENEKDFMEHLTGLDDSEVEDIAGNYPALDENAKKRILKKSLEKSGVPDYTPEEEESAYTEDEESVSGTEHYEGKISWHKYASSAAALIVAIVGITSVVLLHRNMNENDDFDISSPPFEDYSYSEPEQVTEIVSGSYIDKGYRAGGFDYANVNGYEGSVQYGMTTATTEPYEVVTETVVAAAPPVTVHETVAENSIYEDVPPADEEEYNEPEVTQPPETSPPETTAPPVTTTAAVTETYSQTETETTSLPKTMLDGLRYVRNDSTGEYMGFEFRPDGTLTSYIFDDYGNALAGTENICTYEFTENNFSFGISPDNPSWKTGTVANPNDSGNFIVIFPDGSYTFSTEPPVFAEPEISLDGIWRHSGMDEKIITFTSDTFAGSYITAADNSEITFTFERSANDIVFYFDNGEVIAATVTGDDKLAGFDLKFSDGRTEHFSNK